MKTSSKELMAVATELFRRNGFVGTSVDDICAKAGVTKGAFFHHFEGKEALAEACLKEWDRSAGEMEAKAPTAARTDAAARAAGFMDLYIAALTAPKMLKSCLAGTTVQEVSETHPRLRRAADACFVRGKKRFAALLDAACKGAGRRKVDTTSLAELWMATMQGSLILYKASRDPAVIEKTMRHTRQYICQQTGITGKRRKT